jgi:hypothetical protein
VSSVTEVTRFMIEHYGNLYKLQILGSEGSIPQPSQPSLPAPA